MNYNVFMIDSLVIVIIFADLKKNITTEDTE